VSAFEEQALLELLSIQAALGERGWEAVLSGWHVGVIALAVGTKVSNPPTISMEPDVPVGAMQRAAAVRWQRLCHSHGVDPRGAAGALTVLRELGILETRRRFVAERWVVADPLPDATTSTHLDEETRRAAVVARTHFEVGMAVGALLEEGDGVHRSPNRQALADAVGTDLATFDEVAAERREAWLVVDQRDGTVTLEQVADAERDAAMAQIDALPPDPPDQAGARWLT